MATEGEVRFMGRFFKVAGILSVLVVAYVVWGLATRQPGERPQPIVDRGFFGCPSGYVDHPYDPAKCVLPALRDRYQKNMGG